MTTGDFPKIVVTHVGNADREAAVSYTHLKGLKTINDVPEQLREEVKKLLEE